MILILSPERDLQRQFVIRQRIIGSRSKPDLDRDGLDSVPSHPRRRVRGSGRSFRPRSSKVQTHLRLRTVDGSTLQNTDRQGQVRLGQVRLGQVCSAKVRPIMKAGMVLFERYCRNLKLSTDSDHQISTFQGINKKALVN